MMMILGLFVFELGTAPYQEFQRRTAWRHGANNRQGQRPIRQYIGRGDDSITLSGTLRPEITGGSVTLDVLRIMADTGKNWVLIEGTGRIYGQYLIESIDETKKEFFQDGTARVIDFSLSIIRQDNTNVDQIGDLLAMATTVARDLAL